MNTAHSIALIPAYEPNEELLHVIQALRAGGGCAIVVVDDGSSPLSQSIFECASRSAVLLRHDRNLGKGAALKTGLRYIIAHYPADAVIVTVDADGQHTADDALRVCRAAATDGEQFVVGSRAFSGRVPARSRFGNTVTRLVFRAVTGTALRDTQTGLRAFRASLIPFLLAVAGDRYEYEMNVLLECSRRGIPVREVPIETVYHDNNAASHFHALKDSWRIYSHIIKFSASSFVAFLIDYAVYSLMILLTQGLAAPVSLTLSNVTARTLSASTNYLVNRNLVFRNRERIAKTALQYFALALGILAANTLLLNLTTLYVLKNAFVSKIAVELLLFCTSWFIQRTLIFKHSAEKDERTK